MSVNKGKWYATICNKTHFRKSLKVLTVTQNLQRWNKILITGYCQTEKHVEGNYNVNGYGALGPLPGAEVRAGELFYRRRCAVRQGEEQLSRYLYIC